MGDLVGVTGTPGTGKKSISPLVASKLGLPCFGLNELALSYRLVRRPDADQEVDTELFAKKLAARLRGPSVVFGHLLPYVLARRSVATVVVLRCSPSILRRRLVARGYPPQKILQNVEAELIGVIAADAEATFGREKTVEFDTSTLEPAEAATSVVGKIHRRGGEPRIDWTLRYDSASKLRSLLAGRGRESVLT